MGGATWAYARVQQSHVATEPYLDMWSLSDEALLAGLGSGDPEAAAALIRRFQGRVYGLALTIVNDPVAAEDVA